MKTEEAAPESHLFLAAGLSVAAFFLLGAAAAQETTPPKAEPPDPAPVQTLSLARQQYDQAIAGRLYDEAADAGKIYIGILLTDPQHDVRERGAALGRLAYAQRQAGRHHAAIENYALAVELLEADTDRLHPVLAEPLLGLSRAQGSAGKYRDAVFSYNRYLHLEQVNGGPHALRQADAVNELSQIYFELGNHQQANALQQAYVSIYSQNYPDDYLAQLPAHYARANMLAMTDRLMDAQNAYRRIIANIERVDGAQSLHLLPAIYHISDLLRTNRIMDGMDGSEKARRFLRRAVYIANKHEDATPLDIADAHIAYGDFLSVQTVDRRAAFRQYLAAWQQLSEHPEFADELAERLGDPILLNAYGAHSTPAMRKLLMLSQGNQDQYSGRLAVRYDIGSDGRSRDIEIVRGDPSGYWDPIVTGYVKDFVFRPGIVDGEAAEFGDRLFEIRYSLRDQDLPADLRQNGLTKQASFQQ